MPDLRLQGLTKRFGSVLAVSDLSFTVGPGVVTGFLGPNGAGKTTTLRMLLGLVSPDSGTALLNGVPYRDLPNQTRAVGAVLEASGFHPGRSARKHLLAIATASGIDRTRVDEVLAMVGLSEVANARVGGYSMGMRQRLELARAVLGDPEILILDEPANGLDPQGIAWIRQFLRSFASLGRVVLVSSHLLAEAAQTVDEVVILARGHLVGKGRLSEMLDRQAATVRIRTPEHEQARLLAALRDAGFAPGCVNMNDATTVTVQGASPEAVAPVITANGILVYEMTSGGGSLEGLFFEMTEGAGLGDMVPGYSPGAVPGYVRGGER